MENRTRLGKIMLYSTWLMVIVVSLFQRFIDAQSCAEPITSSLRDDQFTASSHQDTDNSPSQARFGGNGWKTGVKDNYQYLKIDLEGLWEITSLQFKDLNSWWKTESFRLSYSLDGYVWRGYKTHTSNDEIGEIFKRTGTMSTVMLSPSIQTRYLAFNPTKDNYYSICLSVELFGCKIANESSDNVKIYTYQNDVIEKDTVWIPTQSPIIVDDMIVVSPTVTLTINAGVSVIFTTSTAGINVYGTLVSHGVEGIHTDFSSSFPVLTKKGLWDRILLKHGGNITMSHTTIRQASVGVEGDGMGIRVIHSLIYGCFSGIRLSGGITSNNTTADADFGDVYIVSDTKSIYNNYGILLHGLPDRPHVAITGSKFNLNEENGVMIDNWDKLTTTETLLYIFKTEMNNNLNRGLFFTENNEHALRLIVKSSIISRNKRHGISLHNSYATTQRLLFSVLDCNISFNGLVGIRYEFHCWRCENDIDHVISSSFIESNGDSQIYFSFESYYTFSDYHIWVEMKNNTIKDSTFVYPIYLNIKNAANGILHFQNNTFENLNGGIELKGSLSFPIHVTVENNIFHNLNGFDTSVILATDAVLNITENSFSKIVQSNVIYLLTGLQHTLRQNKFADISNSNCLLRIGEAFDVNRFINADANYWGTDNKDHARSKICDVFYNSQKARVVSDFMFLTPDMNALTNTSDADKFTRFFDNALKAFVIGGISRADDNMMFEDTDTIVFNRSIIITNGDEVRLAGGTITVMANRGIIVIDGSIRIGSNNTGTKIRGISDSIQWNGIDSFRSDVSYTNTIITNTKYGLNVTDSSSTNTQNGPIDRISIEINNSTLNADGDVINIFKHINNEILIEFSDSYLFSQSGKVLSMHESIQQGRVSETKIIIDNCSFIANEKSVFDLELCSSNITLTSLSSLYSNKKQGTGIQLKSHFVSLKGSENKFDGGHFGIVNQKCDTNQNDRTELDFELTNNNFQSISNVSLFLQGKVNTIYVNENNFSNNAVCVKMDIKVTNVSRIDLTKNVLTDNYADGIIEFINPYLEATTVTINGNTFQRNTGTVLKFSSPNIIIHENIFDNPNSAFNIRFSPIVSPSYDYSNRIVNASFNYWGTASVQEIENGIFDHNYDERLPYVNFRPYYDSKNFSNVLNEEVGFIRGAGKIGGVVDKNVTLSVSDSPYTVVLNILVAEKAILTIEAGVHLMFKKETGITVDGTLKALGSIESVINFGPTAKSNEWNGVDVRSTEGTISRLYNVYLNSSSDGLQVTTLNTRMENVSSVSSTTDGITIVTNASSLSVRYRGLWTSSNGGSGIKIISPNNIDGDESLQIDGCKSNQNKNGIFITASENVLFRNCEVVGNTENGVYVSQENKGSFELTSTLIARNIHYAIRVYNNIRLVIDTCTISDHDYRLYTQYLFQRKPYLILEQGSSTHWNIVINNNLFSRNTNNGIEITFKQWFNKRNDIALSMENNSFVGGLNVLRLRHDCYFESTLKLFIRNNTFSNITLDYNKEELIMINSHCPTDFRIENNSFENIRAESILLFDPSRIANNFETQFSIKKNIFANVYASDALVNVKDFHIMNVTENHFDNKQFGACFIIAPNFNHNNPNFEIIATHNFWKTNSVLEVVERVCGFEKDITKSFIRYFPYYIDDDMKILMDFSHDNFYGFGANGGEVISNINFQPSILDTSDDIVISRSIFIRSDASLTMQGNVTFRFMENRGIYVQGTLIINPVTTNLTSKVVMTNHDPSETWYGILLKSTSGTSYVLGLNMLNTRKGFVVYSGKFNLKQSFIENSQDSCLTLHSLSGTTHDFEGSTFSRCSQYGIFITIGGSLGIQNIEIEHVTIGIYMDEDGGNLNN